ncbi:MAG: oxidoreductase [Desulfobulbaceae bacterium]|nr:oxidoreductase [Desulfobulbaceae bacterium]HIJ78797.1 SDR family NAD(P)-dependent oxidoreductase [Deltaproteobacteria bacterium]
MKKIKVWFVTGASRGLGFEIAKAALKAGHKVVATVRSNPDQLLNQLNGDENLLVSILDVTDKSLVTTSVKAAVDKFGGIDILVNNAGYGLLSGVEEARDEDVRQNYETNVFGLLNVTREVLPQMRLQRSGHIINLSSVGGISGFPGWGIYCSTKFAVEGITESMAFELLPLGIHVTAVEPGFFRTDFLDISSLTVTGKIIADYDDTAGEMRRQMVLTNKKQPGSAAKLAQALIALANCETPPVHLMLGKDTLAVYREKVAKIENEIKKWHTIITSTDHDSISG